MVWLFLGWTSAAHVLAAPVPHAQYKVQLLAREQPIALFLQDLFGQIDVPVWVSPVIKGAVNGDFSGNVESVMRSLSRAFGLVTYWDGAVLHVYAAHELTARVLATPSAVSAQVVRTATEMNLPDSRNTLNITNDGAVVASGTRRFIEQIEALIHSNRSVPTAPPALGFKVFYLRYAWAQDVTMSFSGRQLTVPGVASIIRALVTSSARSPAVTANASPQTIRPTQPKLKGQGLLARGAQLPVLGLPGTTVASSRADDTVAGLDAALPPWDLTADTAMQLKR